VSLVRLYIATTEGPVEVQRIAEEDPAVRSVICLDGRAHALPVSPAYEAFVRKPTGVIERCFGHAAYRMDVSGPIDSGASWQLGAFLAHALHRAGRLAGPKDAAEVAVWCTGEVDHDLNIHPVGGVTEKLERSSELFARLSAAGVRALLFVPAEGGPGARADPGADPLAGLVRAGAPPQRIAHVDAACAALGLPTPQRAATGRAAAQSIDAPAVTAIHDTRESPTDGTSAPVRRRPRVRISVTAAVFMLIAGLVAAGAWSASTVSAWQRLAETGALGELEATLDRAGGGACPPCALLARAYLTHLAASRPDPASIRIDAEERRAPRFVQCEEAASTARLQASALTPDGAGTLPPSRAQGLCSLAFGASASTGLVAIVMLAPPRTQRFGATAATPASPTSAIAGDGARASIELAVPRLVTRPLPILVVALAAPRPLDEAVARLNQLGAGEPDVAAVEAVSARLARLGIAARIVQHALAP